MPVAPVPPGYHSLTPYIFIAGGAAAKAIDFYCRAFGARETLRLADPTGRLGHAEIRIGDCVLMLADECPEMGAIGPTAQCPAGGSLLIYVPDVDAAFERAVAAGAKVLRPVQDQFYGDRSGSLADPFDHHWTLATHIEDVPEAEINRRFAEFFKQPA